MEPDPEVAQLTASLYERVPGGEWRVWRNAGLLYAWRKKTSPPVVIEGRTPDVVLAQVDRWVATGRHPGLPEL